MTTNEEELNYRNHRFYLRHHPEHTRTDDFAWFVIVYNDARSIGSHWLKSREDAVAWGKGNIDAIYNGNHEDFILASMQPGIVPNLS